MMTVEEKPNVTYDDVGGYKEAIAQLREVVELPLLHVSPLVFIGQISSSFLLFLSIIMFMFFVFSQSDSLALVLIHQREFFFMVLLVLVRLCLQEQ
jgi:ATP-dependent Zn protease